MKERVILKCVCILTVISMAIISLDCGSLIMETQTETSENILLIDPGHGGMDGGAVGADGTEEKHINLAIAEKLRDIAERWGWQVIMTRENDEWLCSSEVGSIRSRKTEDLKNRCEIIQRSMPRAAVSIHLNSFKEDASVKGVQVFYPADADEECIRFAEIMQSSLNKELDTGKERTAMVRENVMIFRDTSCPILIIECGFISNKEELQLLKTETYQEQIAAAIMTGIAGFTGCKKPQTVEIIDSLR